MRERCAAGLDDKLLWGAVQVLSCICLCLCLYLCLVFVLSLGRRAGIFLSCNLDLSWLMSDKPSRQVTVGRDRLGFRGAASDRCVGLKGRKRDLTVPGCFLSADMLELSE